MDAPEKNEKAVVVGVISDTHGELFPDVVTALRACDHIVHAGDIDSTTVLNALKDLAPLTIVRGNMDYGGPTGQLPKTAMQKINGAYLYVLHDLGRLDLEPEAAGISVVIHGHTHIPAVETKRGILYVNPGSASFPKSNQPRTMAKIVMQGKTIDAKIVTF